MVAVAWFIVAGGALEIASRLGPNATLALGMACEVLVLGAATLAWCPSRSLNCAVPYRVFDTAIPVGPAASAFASQLKIGTMRAHSDVSAMAEVHGESANRLHSR